MLFAPSFSYTALVSKQSEEIDAELKRLKEKDAKLPKPKGQSKTRRQKVWKALEGDNEFSLCSVDEKPPNLVIKVDGPARPQATLDAKHLWRLFRKIF